MSRRIQASFAAGELAPSLRARPDLAKYQIGLATCRNFIVLPTGGVTNRPGTRFVAWTKGDGPARLLPFEFSAEDALALELGEGYLRFHGQGAPLVVPGTDAVILNGTFDSALTPWTSASTGSAAATVVTTHLPIDPSEGVPIGSLTMGGGLAAAFDGDTTQTILEAAKRDSVATADVGLKWQSGPRIVTGFKLYGTTDQGFKGGSNPVVTFTLQGSDDDFVTQAVSLGSVSVADANSATAEQLTVSTTRAYKAHRIRISGPGSGAAISVAELVLYQRAGRVGVGSLIGAAGGVAAMRQSVATTKLGQVHVLALTVLADTAREVTVRVGASAGGQEIMPDVTVGVGRHLLGFVPSSSPMWVELRNPGLGTVLVDDVALLGSGSASPVPMELATPYEAADLPGLDSVQSLDVLTLTHPGHPPAELRRYGPYRWSLAEIVVGPSIGKPASVTVTPVGTAGTKTYKYRITAVASESLEEGEWTEGQTTTGNASLSATNLNRLSWPAVAGAVKHTVYKESNGLFGFIGSTEATTFDDTGINPALSDTPPKPRRLFGEQGSWPAAIAYHEERLVLAGSEKEPQTIWMSQAGAYTNFNVSEPTKDDDAITFTLLARRFAKVQHLVSLDDLLIFTSGGIWQLKRGQSGITPALEGGVRARTYTPVAPIAPLVAGSAGLFMEARAQHVWDLVRDPVSDGLELKDRSILAAHLVEGRRIVSWCHVRAPWSIVWAVRDDGVLLGLTWERDLDVWAWHRHDTRGAVESVCAVPEGSEDRLYLVVRRVLDGRTRRVVERLASRQLTEVADGCFVDCALTFEDARTVTFSATGPEARATASVPGHGWPAGSTVEIGGTGLALDGRRWSIDVLGPDTLELWDPERGTFVTGADVAGALPSAVLRRAVTTVTGLDHLEGETVAVVADGASIGSSPIFGGALTLARAAARVHIGLSYTAELETLDLPGDPTGEVWTRRKTVREVELFVAGTRALRAGPNRSRLQGYRPRRSEPWGAVPAGAEGRLDIVMDAEWGRRGNLVVVQDEPLPATLLAIVPRFEVGG